MSTGFIKATVINESTMRPMYSGYILYSTREDLSKQTVNDMEDVLFKAQNTIEFVALDDNGDLGAGQPFGRRMLGENSPYISFDVEDVIDENHPKYQECMDKAKVLAKGITVEPGVLVEEPERRTPEVLPWEYIDKNTIWVAHFETGYRTTGTYDEVKQYYEHDDIDEIDTVVWEGQPKELQDFYKAYEYGFYDLNRHELYQLKDFYDEWSKDPNQFIPEHRPVVGRLSEILPGLNPTGDLIVSNYYGHGGAGNHRVGNFIEALNDMGVDFSVVQYDPPKDGRTAHVYIQTDNLDMLRQFSEEANSNAIKHDTYMGDGKYESETYFDGLKAINEALKEMESPKKQEQSFSYVNGISQKLVKPYSKNDKLSVVSLPVDGGYGSLVLPNEQVLNNKYRKDCKNLKLDSNKEYKVYKDGSTLSMTGTDIKDAFDKSREEYKAKMAEYNTEVDSTEADKAVDLEV